MRERLKTIFKGPVVFYTLLLATFPILRSMLARWLGFPYGVQLSPAIAQGFTSPVSYLSLLLCKSVEDSERR